MRKLLYDIFLIALICFGSFNLGLKLQTRVFVTFQPRIIQGSYIRSIDAPTIGKERVKKILDKFNKMGYDEIVSYEGWRPIDIKEADKLDGATIGLAKVRIFDCSIQLEANSLYSENMVEQVILHEYLHCLGYEHTSDPTDLMFASYNESSEDNIRKYAEDAFNRLKKW